MLVHPNEMFVVNKMLPAMLIEMATYGGAMDAIVRPEQERWNSENEYLPLEGRLMKLAETLEAYVPSGVYDHQLDQVLQQVDGLGKLFEGKQSQVKGLDGPDRYREALDAWQRMPVDIAAFGRWPVARLFGALRGSAALDEVIEMIHNRATALGAQDYRVCIPDNQDDFYTRRFTASVDGADATGSPGSRLVWRAYGSPDGREFLGELATLSCEGWRPANPERADNPGVEVCIVPSEEVGQNWSADRQVVHDVVDITPPCSANDFSILRAMVRQYVGPRYADGHISEGEAWDQAVSRPAAMVGAGSQVTVSDLRRALAAEGWYIGDVARRYWYRLAVV